MKPLTGASNEPLLIQKSGDGDEFDRKNAAHEEQAGCEREAHVSPPDVNHGGKRETQHDQHDRFHEILSLAAAITGCVIVCASALPTAVLFSSGLVFFSVPIVSFSGRLTPHLARLARGSVITCLVGMVCYQGARQGAGLSDHALLGALVRGDDLPMTFWMVATLILAASFQTAALFFLLMERIRRAAR